MCYQFLLRRLVAALLMFFTSRLYRSETASINGYGPFSVARAAAAKPSDAANGVTSGENQPVDKLGLVAPWLGLVGLVSLAVLTVVLARRRGRN